MVAIQGIRCLDWCSARQNWGIESFLQLDNSQFLECSLSWLAPLGTTPAMALEAGWTGGPVWTLTVMHTCFNNVPLHLPSSWWYITAFSVVIKKAKLTIFYTETETLSMQNLWTDEINGKEYDDNRQVMGLTAFPPLAPQCLHPVLSSPATTAIKTNEINFLKERKEKE